MRLTKAQTQELEKYADNETADRYYKVSGHACYKLIKITKKHFVFKNCYDKTTVIMFAKKTLDKQHDLGDLCADYMLNKNKGNHLSVDLTINIPLEKQIVKKKSRIKIKKRIIELFKIFPEGAFTSDICLLSGADLVDINSILLELEKEGLLQPRSKNGKRRTSI